ncbi:hypothetical protein AB1A65_03905 [Muricauda sp. ANG21]|uniref:hypothetical protein n=1 Tax=Allomuricauda sp. ANG21 TaxID=3042468 RepID=UPI003454A321
MKKYSRNRVNFKYAAFIVALTIMSACSNEFNQSDLSSGSTEPPMITSIADATENSTVQTGVLGNMYYIKGENLSTTTSIKYNGFDAGFNPTLVTDNTIISQIPLGAPYINASNKLTVETLYGVAEADFSLLTITGFDEGLVDGANAVTLNGGDFTDADQVLFVSGSEDDGNLVEREARIINKTASAITVEVPDGVIQAFIHVFVNGAIAQSTSYGFNYPIFTDELINGWELGGWDGAQELSTEVALGSTSIRRESLSWGGLTFVSNDMTEDLVIADYSAINFQIYPANSETIRVACALNDFDVQVELDLVPGEWNSFSIPLTDFYPPGTAPELITRIDFQEFSAGTAPFLFYVDQVGLIE